MKDAVPITHTDRTRRRQRVAQICAAAAAKISPDPIAAQSQDFLFGDDGMPG